MQRHSGIGFAPYPKLQGHLTRINSESFKRINYTITSLREFCSDAIFEATVYKTVHSMLSDRRRLLFVMSVLSVTFVYCGQTVGRIKMKLGLRVALGPGHIVLDGDPAPPPPEGHSPQFSAHMLSHNGWMDHDATL